MLALELEIVRLHLQLGERECIRIPYRIKRYSLLKLTSCLEGYNLHYVLLAIKYNIFSIHLHINYIL